MTSPLAERMKICFDHSESDPPQLRVKAVMTCIRYPYLYIGRMCTWDCWGARIVSQPEYRCSTDTWDDQAVGRTLEVLIWSFGKRLMLEGLLRSFHGHPRIRVESGTIYTWCPIIYVCIMSVWNMWDLRKKTRPLAELMMICLDRAKSDTLE